MRAAALIIVIAAAILAPPARIEAAPVIHIRARTRITIDRVARTGSGAVVRGRLLEVGSDTPLPGLSLVVSVRGAPSERVVTTSRDGHFAVTFPIGEGQHRLSARFEGDEEYGATELVDVAFDVGKDTPVLQLLVPAEVEAGRPIEGTLVAGVAGDPVALAATLLVAGPKGDFQELFTVPADETGRAGFEIAARQLGGPGEKRLAASFPGDDALNPARVEAAVRVMSNSSFVELGAPTGKVANEATISLTGRLVDEGGGGVPGVTVAINAGGERVGGTRTDDEGRFDARVRASRFQPGDVTLALEYASTTPWRRGARTPPLTLSIAEPRPIPVAYLIGAFALTFAGVVGFALARTRPWVKWLARWNAFLATRKRAGQLEGPDTIVDEVGEVAPATGLRQVRPSIINTLRKAADQVVSGTVRDVVTGRPVAQARLELTLPSQPLIELVTDDEGRFEIGPLAAGTWAGLARASGYVSERFAATLPHRGELREVRIDLLPVREQVFALYRHVAQRLLPKKELWGVWTPREIVDHIKDRRPTGALRALTDLVEEAYFSPRTPDEDVLPEARRRADLARHELGSTREG